MLQRNKGFGVAALVVVAVIAFVAVRAVVYRRPSKPPPSVVTVVSGPKLSGAPAPITFWPQVPTASTAATDGATDSHNVEICGGGTVTTDPENPFLVHDAISKLTDARAAEWLSAMRNSDDNRARAVGLLLQGKVGGGLEGTVMTDEDRDALVQLAVGASDPAVYAMAVYACHAYANPVPGSSCAQLSLNTWAQLDNSNLVPWLLLAEQARVRGDDAAAASAFVHAAKAQKIDSYNYSLFAIADQEQPKDTTQLERWAFAQQVSNVELSMTPPQQALTRHCGDAAMRDDTVRQQCEAVAPLYVAKSTSAIDFVRGLSLGKSVGWSTDRLQTLDQEKFALLEASQQTWPIDTDLWSCNGVAMGNAYWHERLRLGELGALREAIVKTGKSPAELARDFERRLSKYAGSEAQ